MHHQHYVIAAYAVTFGVMTASAFRVWIAGQTYRRQVRLLASNRRPPNKEAR